MNQPSMRELMLRAKQEKLQKLKEQQQQQQDPSSPISTTTSLPSEQSISQLLNNSPISPPVIKTTTLPMVTSSKIPIPTLPQSMINCIDTITLSEVDSYLKENLTELYNKVEGTRCGAKGQRVVLDQKDYCYIQNFLTPHDELAILTLINSTPEQRWNKLSRRHLMVYGGTVLPEGLEEETIPVWLNDLFKMIEKCGVVFYPQVREDKHMNHDKNEKEKIDPLGKNQKKSQLQQDLLHPPNASPSSPQDQVYPNHVLLNYYSPGDLIRPHLDGPAYAPQAVIISLLSALTLSYWSDISDGITGGIASAKMNFYVEPRSLFIMKNGCYHDYLHGIDGVIFDPILSTHINRDNIVYKQQFIPYNEFIDYLDDLRLVRGDGDAEVKKYQQMVEQIENEKERVKSYDNQKNENCDDTSPSSLIGSISRRSERISLTIRRVDPILSKVKVDNGPE